MNIKQKRVAVVAIILIFLTLLWHPYNLIIPSSNSPFGELISSGYKFIWESAAFKVFDYPKLLIEWLAILIISALTYKIFDSDNE